MRPCDEVRNVRMVIIYMILTISILLFALIAVWTCGRAGERSGGWAGGRPGGRSPWHGGHWATLDGKRDSESRRGLAGHGSGPKAPASPLLGRRPGHGPAGGPALLRRQWPRAGGAGQLKNWAPPRSLKPLVAGGGDLVADQRTTQSLPAAGNGVPAPGRQ